MAPSCLVLDVSLPGLNGLDLQRRIAVERTDMPRSGETGVPRLYASLTPRDWEVMALVVSGLLKSGELA